MLRLLRLFLIMILIFIALVSVVFITQNKASIDWVEDYSAGIELAKKQNKPALLCFYRKFTRYSSEMWNNTYNKPSVKINVEANFVPVLIEVDEQPEIAERYKIGYYPTHYVLDSNSGLLDGPHLGSHKLFEFIKRPRGFLAKRR